MPPLDNQRHEIFAQELAKGKPASEAYVLAGYSESGAEPNASRLIRNDKVRQRVVELQERGALRAEVTVESLLQEAEDARLKAMELGQVSAAVAAIREKGVLSGKRVERSEHGQPGEFDGLTSDELRERLAREAAALGFGAEAFESVGGSGEPRGKPN